MRTKLLVGFALLIVSPGLWAQSTPKVEIFGGYSFMRANPGQGTTGANANGWNASFNWNWTHRIGIKADFDGHYCCNGAGQSEHNFLFGPQLTLRHDRWDVFVHGMAGVSHGHAGNVSDTVAAWDVGGGLDYKPFHTERIFVRLAQLDYLGTHYASAAQHNFRYSAGLVFRFGSK